MARKYNVIDTGHSCYVAIAGVRIDFYHYYPAKGEGRVFCGEFGIVYDNRQADRVPTQREVDNGIGRVCMLMNDFVDARECSRQPGDHSMIRKYREVLAEIRAMPA